MSGHIYLSFLLVDVILVLSSHHGFAHGDLQPSFGPDPIRRLAPGVGLSCGEGLGWGRIATTAPRIANSASGFVFSFLLFSLLFSGGLLGA